MLVDQNWVIFRTFFGIFLGEPDLGFGTAVYISVNCPKLYDCPKFFRTSDHPTHMGAFMYLGEPEACVWQASGSPG